VASKQGIKKTGVLHIVKKQADPKTPSIT